MSVRVRFAPSPTGKVHIGNIRTAIFNWLFARHTGGEFLLRVEDTDIERSTREAIDAMFECMEWLGLDHDGEIIYQTSRTGEHIAAAQQLLAEDKAYYGEPDENGKSALLFRIPWDTDNIPVVRTVGTVELELHQESPLNVSAAGVEFAQPSRKGKAMPAAATLAGFKDLKAFNADNKCVFELDGNLDAIRAGQKFTVEGAVKISFTRREVFFNDMIKGELAKPLDSMKDLVIVRGNDTPVFHLANVCDDVFQQISHIVRGDDHVENTYRHILIFNALGCGIPQYAHMPMIVNSEGKPFSKRDGDAFVGDFREKGYLPQALFNYLSLLGWSPGDDREKMTRDEMVEAFMLERVKSSAAQFDYSKLQNMNGMYIAEMSPADFVQWASRYAAAAGLDPASPLFRTVAELMQSRTRNAESLADWKYFFSDELAYNDKPIKKQLKNQDVRDGLTAYKNALATLTGYTPELVEQSIRTVEAAAGLDEGKLNQPLRLAASGTNSGADLYPTMALIGKEKMSARIDALCRYFDENLASGN